MFYTYSFKKTDKKIRIYKHEEIKIKITEPSKHQC